MTHPQRILHLVNNLQPGGIQLLLERVLPRVSPKYAHRVLALSNRGTMKPRYQAAGIKVRHCHIRGPVDRQATAVLAETIRAARPVAVHMHGLNPSMIGMEAVARVGVHRRIVHIHAAHFRAPATPEARRREVQALEGADHLVFCSATSRSVLMERVPGLSRTPNTILPNAVDLDRFTPRTSETPRGARPVIGMFSRLDPVKNHVRMFKAAALLRDAGYDFELRVFGAAHEQYTRSLKEWVEREGLSDRIVFRGHTDHPETALGAVDFFAICSSVEGLPLAILDAWACGVPVVGTRIAGVTDLIEDGVNGLLCEPKSPAALAYALERLMNDPQLCSSLSRGGLLRAREHGAPRVAVQLERIYDEVLKESAFRSSLRSIWQGLRTRLKG